MSVDRLSLRIAVHSETVRLVTEATSVGSSSAVGGSSPASVVSEVVMTATYFATMPTRMAWLTARVLVSTR
jgi:hypothetical protein